MKKTAIVLFLMISTTFCMAQTNPANGNILSADQQESPAGAHNGIARSMQQCASQSRVCQIVAPALYALTEAQPWQTGNFAYSQYQQFGPKSTDPIGCVLDQRYGGPQYLCNNGVASTTNTNTVGAPMFSMSVTSLRTGQFPATPPSLFLTHNLFAGGHDFWYDEVQNDGFRLMNEIHSQASSTQIRAIQRMYSPSDNIGLDLENYGVGAGLIQNEGHELIHGRSGEMAEVYDGTVNSYSCAASGDCTFNLKAKSGQWPLGMMGEGLALIDLTTADTSGYVAAINANVITGSTTTDWARYGTSAATKTTETIADSGSCNSRDGVNTGSGCNTFPRANQVVNVASTTGFSTGQAACFFEAQNAVWECSKITAVGDGTITVATMHYPLESGSTVATGGLTGYGFSLDADTTTRSNGKSYDPDDAPSPDTNIRIVYPIISSNASARTLQIMSSLSGAGNTNFRTYAYQRMGGSGGSVTPSVSGGTVTSCTASGGSGYTADYGAPAQIVLSALPAWTAYPVLTTSNNGTGALNGCTVVNGGTQGSGGTLSASLVPSNPYHIFPQARTWQVWSPTTGGVDGTAVQTTPIAGTFNNGDSIEQPHYFANRESGLTLYNWTYQAGGDRSSLNIYNPGMFTTNDYEAQFVNPNKPQMYGAYPAGSTPWVIGQAGTFGTPYGLTVEGPHANGLWMQLPPYAGNAMAALFVDCRDYSTGNMVCSKWNQAYPVLGVRNQNASNSAYDVLSYNPVTAGWTMTAGATAGNGARASCTFSFGPQGFSESGSGCSGSPGPGAASSGGQSNLAGTTGRIGGSPLAAGACAFGAVGIPGATTSMAVVATPTNDPGDGIFWQGFVRAPGTVVVKVCAAIAEMPNASAYNVRVIP